MFAAITWTLLGATSGLTAIVVVVLALSLVVSVAYVMGLSAVGGYLGGWFANERYGA